MVIGHAKVVVIGFGIREEMFVPPKEKQDDGK